LFDGETNEHASTRIVDVIAAWKEALRHGDYAFGLPADRFGTIKLYGTTNIDQAHSSSNQTDL
jgi:hypothetical protein